MGSRPDYWRNELFYRAGEIERHPGPKRTLPWRGRDVPMQDILPTAAQHNDVAVSKFEKYVRVGKIHEPDKLVSHGRNDVRGAGLCALRLSVVSRPPLSAQCSCPFVFIAYHFQPRTRIVWLVWWPSGSRCSNGSSFSPSQRTIHSSSRGNSSAKCGILSKLPVKLCSAAIRNIKWMNSARQVRILLTMNTYTRTTHLLLQLQVETLLTLLLIACCVRLRRDTFDGATSKLLFIIVDQPKVPSSCLCWSRSEGPFNEVLNSYHRFVTTIWSSSPSYKSSPEKLQTVSVLLQKSSLLLSQNNSTKAHHLPLQPPRCNGKGRGVHSVLHSGVEQRSFAHTVWLLAAVLFTSQ